MSAKTKLQLETELKEALATIAELERDLQKSGQEEKPAGKTTPQKSQTEEDLLKLLEVLPVGVSILDDERKVVFQNSALAHILGMTAEGIRTGAYKDRKYLASDGSAMPADGFASVQAQKSGQAVYNVETGIIKEDGGTIWTSVSAVPADLPDWKMVIVTTDITERKQSEFALQQSEEKYSALFEKSAVPAALTRMPEGVFVDINEAFQSVFGYSRAEVIGKTSLEIGMTLPAERSQTASELEKHNFLRDNEKHLFTKSGEARIATINVSKVKIGGQDFVITTIHDITERKQAEEKLRESEVLLRQVLESIPDSTFAIDLNYRFLVDNQRHQQELIASGGNPFKVGEEILSPDYPPEVLSFWRTAYDRALAGETFSLEGSWVDANGQLHVHENRFSPLYDADERIIGAIVVAHDITERKQAEEALRQSELKFRALVTASSEVLYRMSPDWRTMSQLDGHDFLSNTEQPDPAWKDKYIHPDDQPTVLATIQEAIQTKSTFSLEHRVLLANGDLGWTSSRAIPLLNDQGEIQEWFGAASNITERKQMEEKIRENEEFLRLAYESTDMGVWKNDLVTGNVQFDERARIHCGFDTVQTTLPELMKHIHPDDVARMGSEIAVVTGPTGDGKFATEYRVIHPDGSVHWLAVGVRVVFEGEGEERQAVMRYGTSMDITERKKAEEKLRESEERFRIALKNSPIVVFNQDQDLRYSWIYNPTLGFNPETVLGKTDAELVSVEDAARLTEIKRRVLKTGVAAREEVKTTVGVQTFFYDLTVEPLRDSSGNIIGVTCVSVDITERKQVEENGRIALTKYQTLFDTFPLGISVSDTMGNIVETNAIAEKLIGISKEEQLQREIDDAAWKIIRPDGSPMPIEEFASVIALKENRKVEDVEMGILKPDGNTTWINVTAAPLPLESYGVVVTYADITARIQAQERLNSSQKLLQAIIDNTPALIYTLDIEGRFLLINRPLEILFGQTNAEMIGYRREDFVPPELAQQHRTNDLEIIQTGEGKIFEEENMEPDGRHVYLTTKFPLRDANGMIYAVCGISTDMTERKLIEEELRRSNAELEQFAYIASHDLQEPLRAVAGMVQLLQKRYQGQLDERADEYIRHAVDAAARMQALIQALLSYSRAQRDNQPMEQVDAGTCLQIALKNLDTSIRENHAVITADALPDVHANAAQLTQLFQNLIGNGIKFRRDIEPQIHISATKLADAWQFSVRDNGIGIEPQYFERIFMIFQRLHTQREYSGTGIGLALCRKIIERHGGRIWVESEPQHGSVFHFTLPLRSNT